MVVRSTIVTFGWTSGSKCPDVGVVVGDGGDVVVDPNELNWNFCVRM